MSGWTTTAATANYATAFTNPATKYRRARRNTRAVFAHHPGLFVGTELWSPLSRSAVYRVLRNHGAYRHHTAGRNQSVLIAWDAQEWAVEEAGAFLLHGKVTYGRARRVIADARWCPWARLRHRATGRKTVLVGVHMTPPATKRGAEAVRQATRARNVGYQNLTNWLRDHDGIPALVLGDWNDAWDTILDELDHRDVSPDLTGEEPDFIAGFDGTNADIDVGYRTVVPIPCTDHKGAVFADVTAVAR